MAHLLILYIMTTKTNRKGFLVFMKRFFTILPCFFLLCSLLLCGCTKADFLTEETFLTRFNASGEAPQLKAEDALAKEEEAFIGRSFFLTPKGDETYLLTLQIDKETAELRACSLLYARLEDEESASYFTALVSRTAQAFTGHSAQECEQALKEAGILGAEKADGQNNQSLEWNGFRFQRETVSLGQKMTIETIRKDSPSLQESGAQPTAAEQGTALPETVAATAPQNTAD